MASRKAEVAFFAVVLLVVFGLSEVVLRIYLSRNTFYDIEMSRYARLLKVDHDDPRVGHHHLPGGRAHLMDVDVAINADGFRDDEYLVEKKSQDRVVILGDSLTFGWGVAKENTFEHRLEQRWNEIRPTEVINLGIGNYNTTQEVYLFLDKGLKYRPDQVVLFYFINDAEPVPQKSRYPWLGSSRVITFYWSRIRALITNLTGSGSFQEYYAALYADEAEGWQKSQAAFVALRDTCDREGIALQVVLLPELHSLDPYLFEAEHAKVRSFLERQGIDVLDLAPAFSTVPDPLTLWVAMDDAHPNAEAHRLIAKYSFGFLEEKRH